MVSQRDKPPEIKQGLSNKEQHLEILQTFLKTTYRTRPNLPKRQSHSNKQGSYIDSFAVTKNLLRQTKMGTKQQLTI